jgi:6-phosphogluconolactonase (cycloisomerase 2 family)
MSMLWWGTYPVAGLGTEPGLGEGLWRQDPGTGEAFQVMELPAPSFVLAHPDLPVLYVGLETDPSAVVVVDVADVRQPRVNARVSTGGNSACHLLLSRDQRTLYVSHYGSGDIAVIPLDQHGLPLHPTPVQVLGHSGTGPREDRQEGPHAHFAQYAPGGDHLLVADLGTDELRRYRIGAGGELVADGVAATLPPGAGPRHFSVRGEHLYVVCELDHTLRTLRWDPVSATAEVIAEQPTTLAPQRTGDALYDAHVALVPAPDGSARSDVLLVSVRGADVISVFDLSPEGEARYRGAFDTGYWPRFFAVVGDTLHVGAERGHHARAYPLATVLALSPETERGAVAELPYRAAVIDSPACVAVR